MKEAVFVKEISYQRLYEEALMDDKKVALYCAISYANHNERLKTLTINCIRKYSGIRTRDIRKLIYKMSEDGWFSFKESRSGFIFKMNECFNDEFAFISQLYKIGKPLLKIYLFFKNIIPESGALSIPKDQIAYLTQTSRQSVFDAKSLFVNLGLFYVERYKQEMKNIQKSDGIVHIPFEKSEAGLLFYSHGNDVEKYFDELDFKSKIDNDSSMLDIYKIITQNKVHPKHSKFYRYIDPAANFDIFAAGSSKIYRNIEIINSKEFKYKNNKMSKLKLGDIEKGLILDNTSVTEEQGNNVFQVEINLVKEENSSLEKQETFIKKEISSFQGSLDFSIDTNSLSPNTEILTPVNPTKENEMNTQDCVLYIYNTWNEHAVQSGGFLKPSPVPRSLVKNGSHNAKNSLPSAIAEWVLDNYSDWQETWDSVIEKSKTNKLFNGKVCLVSNMTPGRWSPTLKWFFKDRGRYNKDMGINAFLDGDFNAYDEQTFEPKVEEAVKSIVKDWNDRCSKFKWQKTDDLNDTLRIAIASWVIRFQENWEDKWNTFLKKAEINKFIRNEAFEKYIVNLYWLFEDMNIEYVLADRYRTFDNWTEFKSEVLSSKPANSISIYANMKR